MYVSDLIADSYRTWRPGERILVSAGCGTGKTSFAVGPLAEYARVEGRSILYLTPRKALNHSLVSRHSQAGVCYRTYQAVEQELLDGQNPLSGYDYIVCDESHYFVADSTFNFRTEESWRAIAASSAVVIYMTGTPDGLKTLAGLAGMELREYAIPAQTGHIRKVVWTASKAEYIDSIVRTAKEGKKLIAFFASKTDMCRCAGRLTEAKISVETYDADGRTTKVMPDGRTTTIPKLPAQDGLGYTLTAQCLLATTYLNSGVELWDAYITDVFSDILDVDETIQALYRKRCHPGERITLHVRVYSAAEIQMATSDERTALIHARTYKKVQEGLAWGDECVKWEPGWEKQTRILRLARTPIGREYVETVDTAMAHAMRASAIVDAVTTGGMSYKDLILDALGMSGTTRQADDLAERLEDARRWLEPRVDMEIDTEDLSQILAIRSKGHRDYIKAPSALNRIIEPMGYNIKLVKVKGKRTKVLMRGRKEAS